MRFKLYFNSDINDTYRFDPNGSKHQIVDIADLKELKKLYEYYDNNELIINFDNRTIVIYDEWEENYESGTGINT